MMYLDVLSSIQKFLTDFHSKHYGEGWETFDFDSHASVDQLPDKNLIGVAQYALLNDEETYKATLMITFSTRGDDENLKELRNAVNLMCHHLRAGKVIQTITTDQGKVTGALKVMSPIEVLPVAGTEGRPLIGMAVSFGCTSIVPP